MALEEVDVVMTMADGFYVGFQENANKLICLVIFILFCI
jgi:hypothetical protein